MEDQETRIKRLKIRSWRRGTKEMDLYFGRYADAFLEEMSTSELDAFEALLANEDSDVAAWVTGTARVPDVFAETVKTLRDYSISLKF